MPRGTRATGYGAAGGRRNTPARSAKQLTRQHNRQNDPRVKAAMAEVEEARAEVDALMAENREGAVAGALYQAARKKLEKAEHRQEYAEKLANDEITLPPPRPKPLRLPATGDGGKGWTKGQARAMLMQGYTLEAVVRRTGFGTDSFDDIPLKDGRGVSREEWMIAQEEKAARLEREGRKLT